MNNSKSNPGIHTHNQTKVLLVYFSGTGGVRKIADSFEYELEKKSIPVIRHSLDRTELSGLKENYHNIIKDITLIILLYPVHAFNAPLPVFNWIESLPSSNMISTAIISVSGGGEVSLNRASRHNCITALKKKVCYVFYETMMVMPCNWYIPTPDELAIQLIRCIPGKTIQILNHILSGTPRRTRLGFFTRIAASFISRLESTGMKKFGKWLCVSDTCTGCKWCVRHCPQGNIHLSDGKPEFGKDCIMCFRCIYGCPHNSIYATKAKFMVIKDGFNLDKLEKRMAGVYPESLEQYGKGILWKGVKKYLRNSHSPK